jgi:predicted metal-binding protein
MSDSGTAGRATITVCITCRATGDPMDSPRAGMALANATAVAATGVCDISVQRVRCLGNCNRGLSAAIRCDNAWSYVFGGLEPARDGPSLIIGAQLLAQASDGIMPWRGRPDSLKRGLIARVPPLNFPDELP